MREKWNNPELLHTDREKWQNWWMYIFHPRRKYWHAGRHAKQTEQQYNIHQVTKITRWCINWIFKMCLFQIDNPTCPHIGKGHPRVFKVLFHFSLPRRSAQKPGCYSTFQVQHRIQHDHSSHKFIEQGLIYQPNYRNWQFSIHGCHRNTLQHFLPKKREKKF